MLVDGSIWFLEDFLQQEIVYNIGLDITAALEIEEQNYETNTLM